MGHTIATTFLPRSYCQTSRISQGEFFVFQQDGAPAHRARDTVSFLKRETPDFIPPTLWAPNSPDLNPVENSIIMKCAAGKGLPLQNSQRRRTQIASDRVGAH